LFQDQVAPNLGLQGIPAFSQVNVSSEVLAVSVYFLCVRVNGRTRCHREACVPSCHARQEVAPCCEVLGQTQHVALDLSVLQGDSPFTPASSTGYFIASQPFLDLLEQILPQTLFARVFGCTRSKARGKAIRCPFSSPTWPTIPKITAGKARLAAG